MAICVINPGAFTTVQDLGRFGYQSSGIPQSGAMDQAAFEVGNRILENVPNAAALEMTLYGGIYRFDADAVIALTGADMKPAIGGVPIAMYAPVQVHAGDILALSTAVYGCRTYLCTRGGIQVPPVLGSRSTTVRCALGGLEGRALRAGDRLPLLSDPQESSAFYGSNAGDDSFGKSGASGTEAGAFFEIPERGIFAGTAGKSGTPGTTANSYMAKIRADIITVRAVPGPQDEYFTSRGLETFFCTEYIVSTDSDRMGCRLQGKPIESKNGTDIISDGTAFGSVQVPSSGLPIVLMADRQTTGGYAKIATVISADLPLLAQARPGNRIHFQKVFLEE